MLKVDPNQNPLASQPRAQTAAATDFRQFAALRRGADAGDPKVLREAARQFESLFTKMMLDSMRKASFGDPVFGSDQGDMYQGMMDDQLAMQMSSGKGLGLADMLIRQLSHGAVSNPNDGAEAGSADPGKTVTPEQKQKFIEKILPHATAAARELGVDARSIVAQAALETGWGTSQPADGGGASHNLFGIKAGASWTGASVASGTTEYVNGSATSENARFRAYDSVAAGMKDYVHVLRDNPRYAAALGTGSDVHAFATALQRGGYATDPDYARKLVSVANDVVLPSGVNEFKSGDDSPIPHREPSRVMSNG